MLSPVLPSFLPGFSMLLWSLRMMMLLQKCKGKKKGSIYVLFGLFSSGPTLREDARVHIKATAYL